MTRKVELIDEALAFIARHGTKLEELKSSKPSRQDFARSLGNEYFHELRRHVKTLPTPKLGSIFLSKPGSANLSPDQTTVRDIDPGLDCINIDASGETIMHLVVTFLIMAEVTDQLFQVAKINLRAAA